MPETDLGLFGPDSVSWRVHREPILLVAGLRALYLQALHPQAVAGVTQNSHYREDPWGRLERTSIYLATVVYGTTEQAMAAGDRVRSRHERMRATDPRTGEQYRLDRPDLLRWVHVTEVESFVTTARRAGLRLTDAEVDRYYDEQRRAAALVGLDPRTVPASAVQVQTYYQQMRPRLALSKDAADTAVFLAAPPLPGRLGLTPVRLLYTGIVALAVGLLPGWARRMYGLLGLPTTDLPVAVSVRTLRSALGLLPRSMIEGPIVRGAMTRAAAFAQAAATQAAA